MAFDCLPDELVCLIFKQLLEFDYYSYLALSKTCHRFNELSKRVRPSYFAPQAIFCKNSFYRNLIKHVPYGDSNVRIFSDVHQQRYCFYRMKQEFYYLCKIFRQGSPRYPPFEDPLLYCFGHSLPFFWFKLGKLKYIRIHNICFMETSLYDHKSIDYIAWLIEEKFLDRDNYKSVTTLELRYTKTVNLEWLDKVLFLLENIKILLISTFKRYRRFDSTSSDYLYELMEIRRPKILEQLHLNMYCSMPMGNEELIVYLTKFYPSKIFCSYNTSYHLIKDYLHANVTVLKEYRADKAYEDAIKDDLLKEVTIKLSEDSYYSVSNKE